MELGESKNSKSALKGEELINVDDSSLPYVKLEGIAIEGSELYLAFDGKKPDFRKAQLPSK